MITLTKEETNRQENLILDLVDQLPNYEWKIIRYFIDLYRNSEKQPAPPELSWCFSEKEYRTPHQPYHWLNFSAFGKDVAICIGSYINQEIYKCFDIENKYIKNKEVVFPKEVLDFFADYYNDRNYEEEIMFDRNTHGKFSSNNYREFCKNERKLLKLVIDYEDLNSSAKKCADNLFSKTERKWCVDSHAYKTIIKDIYQVSEFNWRIYISLVADLIVKKGSEKIYLSRA